MSSKLHLGIVGACGRGASFKAACDAMGDVVVHAVRGLLRDHYQSLYHFTIGVPLEDRRLQTLAPYHHLERI